MYVEVCWEKTMSKCHTSLKSQNTKENLRIQINPCFNEHFNELSLSPGCLFNELSLSPGCLFTKLTSFCDNQIPFRLKKKTVPQVHGTIFQQIDKNRTPRAQLDIIEELEQFFPIEYLNDIQLTHQKDQKEEIKFKIQMVSKSGLGM